MKKILLFGTGKYAQKFLNTLDYNEFQILALIENDKSKQGQKFDNNKIIIPEQINNYNYDYVVISSKSSYLNIRNQLLNIDVNKNKIIPNLSWVDFDLKKYFENINKLKNKNFSIISDDCFAGHVYTNLGLEYNTPFIWLYLLPDDYIKLLKNTKYYLNCQLKFSDSNEYNYPVGLLDDINIYFLHYKTKEEAKNKWYRRLERFNWDNYFVEQTIYSKEIAKEFDKLDIKNKIAFTEENYNLKSCVHFKNWNINPPENYYKQFKQYVLNEYYLHFDIINWLNANNIQ